MAPQVGAGGALTSTPTGEWWKSSVLNLCHSNRTKFFDDFPDHFTTRPS